MKRLAVLGLIVCSVSCGNDDALETNQVDSSLAESSIIYRLPVVYVSDDSPGFAPSMCFIGQNADVILVGEVINISSVFVPEIECGGAKNEFQRPYQEVDIRTSDGTVRKVIAEVTQQPHDDLVPKQKVLMGIMELDKNYLNTYFLIDDAKGDVLTANMPKTISELIQTSEFLTCGERTVSSDVVALDMFSPPDGACNATAKPSEVEDGL
jgi:hypothetical protein